MTIHAYLDTEYGLASTSQYFKVGYKHSDEEGVFRSNGVKTYAWLTAVNPRSKILSNYINQKRMRALKADLNGVMCFEGSSCSSDGNWKEEGVWVCNRGIHYLRKIGEKYDQNAFTFAIMGHSMQLVIL